MVWAQKSAGLSPTDTHVGIRSFMCLDPGCGDARVGEMSKSFGHYRRRVVFTITNSTGRSPIFILAFFQTFADRMAHFEL
jgi:hypothetical protein